LFNKNYFVFTENSGALQLPAVLVALRSWPHDHRGRRHEHLRPPPTQEWKEGARHATLGGRNHIARNHQVRVEFCKIFTFTKILPRCYLWRFVAVQAIGIRSFSDFPGFFSQLQYIVVGADLYFSRFMHFSISEMFVTLK